MRQRVSAPLTYVSVTIHVPDYEHVDNPSPDDVWAYYQTSGGVTEATMPARPSDGSGGFVKTRAVTYEFKVR